MTEISDHQRSENFHYLLSQSRPVIMAITNRSKFYVLEYYINAGSVHLGENYLSIFSGSKIEGTHIEHDHKQQSELFSDIDYMYLMHRVKIDASTIYGNSYIHLNTEKATRPGFRKLRVDIDRFPRCPENPSELAHLPIIRDSLINYNVSSELFIAVMGNTQQSNLFMKNDQTQDEGIHGPAQTIIMQGKTMDDVYCFHVESWPEEANDWYERKTKWPSRQIKTEIKQTGFLLVAVGHNSSPEKHLEWRCSFSIAEKILFSHRSLTSSVQLLAFYVLKNLCKEYLHSVKDHKGDSILSSYHLKTVFFWYLETDHIIWEPKYMLSHISSMIEILHSWIEIEYFPHYFISKSNIFEDKFIGMFERKNQLLTLLTDLEQDLWNKIKSSELLSCCMINQADPMFWFRHQDNLYHYLNDDLYMWSVQYQINTKAFLILALEKDHPCIKMNTEIFDNLSNTIITMNERMDPQLRKIYKIIFNVSDWNEKVLNFVALQAQQYCECLKLAKYSRNQRDNIPQTYDLHDIRMSLIASHPDPCTFSIKLACASMIINDYETAHDLLLMTEEKYYDYRDYSFDNVFHIVPGTFMNYFSHCMVVPTVISWMEYNIVPSLFQYELISAISQYKKHVQEICYCYLKWDAIVVIKFFKFICLHHLGAGLERKETCLHSELIRTALNVSFIDEMYTVFNIAAWCYANLNNYKEASHMCIVAIQNNMGKFNKCTFSQHFVSYVIKQCL